MTLILALYFGVMATCIFHAYIGVPIEYMYVILHPTEVSVSTLSIATFCFAWGFKGICTMTLATDHEGYGHIF